ncbi:Ig-like domain-containing protein [Clostridium sp. chh4-2]|uniref:lectin like domain-containing protein n=1 Tax=Clostridium sp. chh4-2 TaxID=2067550 RepID=UPI0015E1699F|nr:Ig-like domain-containing protein [Clostridium sp. chh4-2]
MGERLERLKRTFRRKTAWFLAAVMLGVYETTALGTIMVYALPDPAAVDEEAEDLWEKVESGGEVIIAFPSQLEAVISSAEDEDRYSFRLEDETDLTLSLESDYPCDLELISKERVIGESRKPYSQILEPAGLEAGTYTVRIVPHEGTERASYTLRVAGQADRKKKPDYSEAHIAGTIFDPESPFRYLNIQNAEEKDQGSSPIAVMHYLAHWQGPVNESVVPYYSKGDYGEIPGDYIFYKKANPEFHEQNAIILPGNNGDGKHIEHWKNAIMTYGAVQTGFYTSYKYLDKNEGDGYPDWDLRYFYAPNDMEYERFGGHSTLIVGWDDTVKRENFRVTQREIPSDVEPDGSNIKLIKETMPEHDGAWICRDSYGTDNIYGVPDYFYVSYESCDFGVPAFTPSAYAPGEKNDNYNHMYSNSAGGLIDVAVGNTGFLRGVEVFHNDGDAELLRAVGFAVGQGELSYEIGIRIEDGPVEKVKSGYIKYSGFHTVRLEDGIMIPKDADFEIHVAFSNDDHRKISFFTSRNVENWVNGVTAIPGKAFYYTSWSDETDLIDASALSEYPCIYAYTYASSDRGITILDNKEKAEGYDPFPGTATSSNAEADTETDIGTDIGGVTETDEGETAVETATSSNADKNAVSTDIRKNRKHSKTASPSDADYDDGMDIEDDAVYEEDRDENADIIDEYGVATSSNAESFNGAGEDILEDDLQLIEQKENEGKEELFKNRQMRIRDTGAVPLENVEPSEIGPLNLNLPAAYDSRDYHLITEAKHQGNSSICWAFSAAGALEASYLRYGNQLINYPRGLNIISREEAITDGTVSLKLKQGQTIPLDFSAVLYSDSEYFSPGSPQVYWEITGDLGSVEKGKILSESGEETTVLTAKAPGKVTVTAVSMADMSLKASCQIEITESAPAKVFVKPESLTMNVGDMQVLETTVEAEEELTVIYSSDRPDIVSVDKTGRILALKPGEAVITAKAGDGQASCRITVRDRTGSKHSSRPVRSAERREVPDTVSGSWEQNGGGWLFKKTDGSYAQSSWERIGGLWYYFKEDCLAASGWLNQGETWYYLSQDAASYGRMETGWVYDPSFQRWFYLEENGAMSVGWREIDGKWYYFHTESDGGKGKMYAGERTPDGYKTGPNGEWVP